MLLPHKSVKLERVTASSQSLLIDNQFFLGKFENMDYSKDTLLMQYDELVRCYDVLVDSTNLEKTVLR